jgi:hypothetical protein
MESEYKDEWEDEYDWEHKIFVLLFVLENANHLRPI